MIAWEIAEKGLILRAVVGSTSHGIQIEGTDDLDMMGVCVEPPEYVMGLRRFEQYIFRSAEVREQHSASADRTPRSEPGDLDLVVYGLKKYVSLAAKGNPSILALLFAEPNFTTKWGQRLRDQAGLFASREAGARFLGYLRAQKERLLGQRGQMRVTRSELIERHGYDSKFAAHAVRLGYEGIEYMQSGQITLPMEEGRDYCLSVRRGEVSLPEVTEKIDGLEAELHRLVFGSSPLPARVDHEAIDALLVSIYRDAWEELWT